MVRLRWKAEKLGIERLILKNETLKGHFASSENAAFYNSELFGGVLSYVQSNPASCKLRELKNRVIVIIDNVPDVERATEILEKMLIINTVITQ